MNIVNMNILNKKLFGVLAGAVEVDDFEQWLYANTALLSIVVENPFVFDVYNLNYKSDSILKSIENLCKDIDDEEAFLVSIVERECRYIVATKIEESILASIDSILEIYTFDDEKELLFEFYCLNEQIQDSIEGFGQKINILNESYRLANQVLNELEFKSLEDKKELLITGTFIRRTHQAFKTSKKFWYQFWK